MTHTDPRGPRPSSRVAVAAAVVAGVAGVGLLVFGIVGLIRSIDFGSSSPATTVGFVTTTTVPAVVTTDVPVPQTIDASGFQTIVDDSGTLTASVPAEWADVSGGAWAVDGTTVGVSVSAAIDRDAWYSGWGTPGVFIGVTTVGADVYSPDLGDFSGACTFADAGDGDHPGYTTIVQVWTDCGDEGSEFTTALVWPSTFEYAAIVQLVTLDGTGAELLDHIVTTLSYMP